MLSATPRLGILTNCQGMADSASDVKVKPAMIARRVFEPNKEEEVPDDAGEQSEVDDLNHLLVTTFWGSLSGMQQRSPYYKPNRDVRQRSCNAEQSDTNGRGKFEELR
ncbi:MAG: hypothetical protein R2832_17285 [Rhodothermales bacterium]